MTDLKNPAPTIFFSSSSPHFRIQEEPASHPSRLSQFYLPAGWGQRPVSPSRKILPTLLLLPTPGLVNPRTLLLPISGLDIILWTLLLPTQSERDSPSQKIPHSHRLRLLGHFSTWHNLPAFLVCVLPLDRPLHDRGDLPHFIQYSVSQDSEILMAPGKHKIRLVCANVGNIWFPGNLSLSLGKGL